VISNLRERWLGGGLSLLLLLVTCVPAFAMPRRQAWATARFNAAEQLRKDLTQVASNQRTRHDYQRVINAYRHVYYGAPISSKADVSVFISAGLLLEMGRHFNDEKILRSAVNEYGFLRREYPGSKYRFDALFNVAEIYKEDLGDAAKAQDTFERYLKQYPHSHLAEEARAALKECEDAAKATPRKRSPRVISIKHWTAPDYTRVVINLDGETRFYALRIDHPDRILFDLPDTELAHGLMGNTMDVGDGFVRKIRVAENKPGSTRVVLDVDDSTDYSASLASNPARLIIDVRSRHDQASKALRSKSVLDGKSKAELADLNDDPPALQAGGARGRDLQPARKTTHKARVSTPTDDDFDLDESPSSKSAIDHKVKKVVVDADDDSSDDPRRHGAQTSSTKTTASSNRTGRKSIVRETGAHEAKPTATGDRSLIRALGLKIGRIVIDPGHGGHDTGTIGPSGLMEKDLVLDVAKRLGNLLSNHLGADVVYTRDDDTFIPLENRTAIANEEQADLFVSIHANSSDDPDARGVETYYLNFTSSADALEVAARENAASDKSVHELQDLVKKIALKEKVEESREFAADVQKSLYTGLSAKTPAFRDRGVKKAPFVVLIGANMPSILAEISFVSNPTDERKLESKLYRQRIAESLYRGIARYANGLSGVKVATRLPKAAGQ
jgi:N-acetylmuramoyl-L-alanine amidase